MKRIGYDSYGGPDVMQVQEFTLPQPGPHEVAVTVKAASINPIDWKVRQGIFRQVSGETFPRGMGSEFAGVISQVGENVIDFQTGDEVVGAMTFQAQSAFAEGVVASETMLAKKPNELSFVEAAGVGLVGVTAWLALVKTADLKVGQHVLINGALGGVGQAAVTLAKSLGAHTTGRVSPRSTVEAQALGLDVVLDYTQPVPASLAGTFDVIFDVNGSLTPDLTEPLLNPAGIVVDINPTPEKMAAVQTSPHRHKLVFAEGTRANLETALHLAAKGDLRTPVTQARPFAEAIALITSLENGHRVSGKSVITFA